MAEFLLYIYTCIYMYANSLPAFVPLLLLRLPATENIVVPPFYYTCKYQLKLKSTKSTNLE